MMLAGLALLSGPKPPYDCPAMIWDSQVWPWFLPNPGPKLALSSLRMPKIVLSWARGIGPHASLRLHWFHLDSYEARQARNGTKLLKGRKRSAQWCRVLYPNILHD